MTHPDSSSFGVWIGDRRAGTIQRFGDRTRFSLDPDYREDPDRPCSGLSSKTARSGSMSPLLGSRRGSRTCSPREGCGTGSPGNAA